MSFKNKMISDCDSNKIWTHNHLVLKQTINHLTKLAKWLSVHLQTKWLWVQIPLLSLKLKILCLLWARSSLTFRQTIECRFNLKFVRDMIITYNVRLCFVQLICVLNSKTNCWGQFRSVFKAFFGWSKTL